MGCSRTLSLSLAGAPGAPFAHAAVRRSVVGPNGPLRRLRARSRIASLSRRSRVSDDRHGYAARLAARVEPRQLRDPELRALRAALRRAGRGGSRALLGPRG